MRISEILENQKHGIYLQQKTDAWYEARNNMLTASDCAAALDCNQYESSRELLIRKTSLGVGSSESSPAVAWGNMYEPIARDFYAAQIGCVVHEVGLIPHREYPWLGASPDGVVCGIGGKSGKIVEIKCPVTRKVTGDVPYPYWIQIQIQLEVCDVDVCDFVDCEFEVCDEEQYTRAKGAKGLMLNKPWHLKTYAITSVTRDRAWFADNIGALTTFWNRVVAARNAIARNATEPRTRNATEPRTRKRKADDLPVGTQPAKRQLGTQPAKRQAGIPTSETLDPLIDWTKWVAATKTRNFMLDDPLLDWLDYYGAAEGQLASAESQLASAESQLASAESQLTAIPTAISVALPTTFTNFIMARGTEFEAQVMKELFARFPDDIVTIADKSQARCPKKCEETKAAIARGVPIIYQGVLHNHANRTYGMPDLIVRSDWLNKLFLEPVLRTNTRHYRIVDIKAITLDLRADGTHILKTGGIDAIKSQLYVYNMALSQVQGYAAPKSYVLGQRWQYMKKNVMYSGEDPFDRAGHVDFKTIDRHIRKKTRNALSWINKMRRHGSSFVLNPPSHSELYPNMSNTQDEPWRAVKSRLAHDIGEITLLWNCGPNNRNIAHSNDIRSWSDPRCCPALLGVAGGKTSRVLQAILDANQAQTLPKKIKHDGFDVLRDYVKGKGNGQGASLGPYHVFVDFETITDDFRLFMIGVGYLDQNDLATWKYKCFCANELTNAEELRIFTEFHELIAHLRELNGGYVGLVHWSHAELTIYRKVRARYFPVCARHLLVHARHLPVHAEPTWVDLLKIFREEPVTIQGALNFSLKSVAKAFYAQGLIKTTWDDGPISDGLTAMVHAKKVYENLHSASGNIINSNPIMREIMRYNEVDVKTLCEILFYLGQL